MSLFNLVVCLKILIREFLFYGKQENWDQNHAVKFSQSTRLYKKIGEESVHPEGSVECASLMSVILSAPIEARTMPAPTSKLLEERELPIGSGTSMHMLSKRHLRSDEMETLRDPEPLPWKCRQPGSTSVCSRSWPLRDCATTRTFAVWNHG